MAIVVKLNLEDDVNDVGVEDFFRRNYNLNAEKNVLLFVGQLIRQKNLRFIINVMELLKKRNFDFHLYIIGEGPAEHELKKMVTEKKLTHLITFTGKIADREILKKFYHRANLFLFPSLYDNSPLVIRESAALATASLVLKGTDACEGIKDGYNGFITNHNIIEYSDKIQSLFQQQGLLKHAGTKAGETLAVPWKNIVDLVASRYCEIIEKHQSNMRRRNFKIHSSEFM